MIEEIVWRCNLCRQTATIHRPAWDQGLVPPGWREWVLRTDLSPGEGPPAHIPAVHLAVCPDCMTALTTFLIRYPDEVTSAMANLAYSLSRSAGIRDVPADHPPSG